MKDTEKLETGSEGAESSTKVLPGGEETGSKGTESSNDGEAAGNFLTDLLGDEGDGSGGDGGSAQGGSSEAGDGSDGDGEGSEDQGEVTADMAGDELALGDTLSKGGKLLANGEVKLENGTVVKTDAEGKIIEITESDGGEEETGDGLFELKHDNDVEKFDLRKKEDLEKVREYAQKGKRFEVKMQELKEQEKVLSSNRELFESNQAALAYNMLYLQNAGKLNSDEFEEKPYEDFIGSSAKMNEDGEIIEEATAEKDRKLWNDHKKRVAANLNTLNEYKTAFSKTSAGYRQMVNDFQAKHKDISDVKAWINENVGRFSKAILSFGAEEYDPDTLEMVYHWVNREKIEKDIREDERKKKAKVVIKKDNGVKRAGTAVSTAADEFIDDVLGSKFSRKIVH